MAVKSSKVRSLIYTDTRRLIINAFRHARFYQKPMHLYEKNDAPGHYFMSLKQGFSNAKHVGLIQTRNGSLKGHYFAHCHQQTKAHQYPKL